MTSILVIVAIYVLMMVTIGIISAKKAKSLTAFVVGGRKAGPWMSAFAYGTTYFSAVLFIGYAGRSGFDFGIWAVLIGVANAFIGTYLAWKLLAEKTRESTRRLKIKSMPQLFETRYNSRGLKIATAVIIFIFMIPYSASVYSGLSYLCSKVLGIDYQIVMLIIAAVTAVSLILGGYAGTLIADLVQGFIMIFGMIAMVIFLIKSDAVGGISGIISNPTPILTTNFDSTFTMILSLIGLVLLTSIGTWGMPQMVHKFYAIENKKAIKSGTIISTVFAVIIAGGSYFAGALSKYFFSEVPKGGYDTIIPEMISGALPNVLLGVILILVLSASISTLSGITLTSCSTVSMDLLKDELFKGMSSKRTFTITRVLCFLFVVLSFILASFKSPILVLMSFSWGTITGAFLAPYMLGLYWKKMNKVGAISAVAVGVLTNILLAVFSNFNAGFAPLFGVISVVLSFAAAFIGSKIGNNLKIDFSKENEFFTLDKTKEN